jgi:hypothetical protein
MSDHVLQEPKGKKEHAQMDSINAYADATMVALLEMGKLISVIADQLEETNGHLAMLALYYEKKGRSEGVITDEDMEPEEEGDKDGTGKSDDGKN